MVVVDVKKEPGIFRLELDIVTCTYVVHWRIFR